MNEKGLIIIYNNNVEVKLIDNNVWMTQDQLVSLYQSSKSNISEHIKHIFEEGELDEESVVRNFRITASDGKIDMKPVPNKNGTYEHPCPENIRGSELLT